MSYSVWAAPWDLQSTRLYRNNIGNVQSLNPLYFTSGHIPSELRNVMFACFTPFQSKLWLKRNSHKIGLRSRHTYIYRVPISIYGNFLNFILFFSWAIFALLFGLRPVAKGNSIVCMCAWLKWKELANNIFIQKSLTYKSNQKQNEYSKQQELNHFFFHCFNFNE